MTIVKDIQRNGSLAAVFKGVSLFAFTLSFLLSDPISAAVTMLEPDEQGIQRASISMDSYSYSPNELSVQAGKLVELTFRNNATFVPHTFVLDDAAAGLRVRVEVSAGESKTVQFTPNQRGMFTFYCDKKLLFFKSHRERGHEGRLQVR